MKNTTDEIELNKLWEILAQKFSTDLNIAFSNKDVEGYLNHFVPNKKINIYQYGKDATGKKGKGKTIKIYTGNLLSSLIKGRIPAKLMAKILFKRLTEQNYSHSEIELLGIQKDQEVENHAFTKIRFKRFNMSGKMYQSAIGIYALTEIKGKWYINEMSIYDDKVITKVDLNKMWHPKK